MNWIETLLITLGISLDIFGIVTCEGALLAEINKKRLAAGSLLVALLQTIALYLGDLVGGASLRYDIKDKQILTVRVIVAIIFIVLGVRMILKSMEEQEYRGTQRGKWTEPWKDLKMCRCFQRVYTFSRSGVWISRYQCDDRADHGGMSHRSHGCVWYVYRISLRI